jgi:TRAP-type C4-dicarboxylate transport system permease small subunit
MSIYGFDIVLRVTRESAAMELPLGWVYAAPVVGMVLTSFRLVQEFYTLVKRLKQPNHPLIKGETELREEIV